MISLKDENGDDIKKSTTIFQCKCCETAYRTFDDAKNCNCAESVIELRECNKCHCWWDKSKNVCCGVLL